MSLGTTNPTPSATFWTAESHSRAASDRRVDLNTNCRPDPVQFVTKARLRWPPAKGLMPASMPQLSIGGRTANYPTVEIEECVSGRPPTRTGLDSVRPNAYAERGAAKASRNRSQAGWAKPLTLIDVAKCTDVDRSGTVIADSGGENGLRAQTTAYCSGCEAALARVLICAETSCRQYVVNQFTNSRGADQAFKRQTVFMALY